MFVFVFLLNFLILFIWVIRRNNFVIRSLNFWSPSYFAIRALLQKPTIKFENFFPLINVIELIVFQNWIRSNESCLKKRAVADKSHFTRYILFLFRQKPFISIGPWCFQIGVYFNNTINNLVPTFFGIIFIFHNDWVKFINSPGKNLIVLFLLIYDVDVLGICSLLQLHLALLMWKEPWVGELKAIRLSNLTQLSTWVVFPLSYVVLDHSLTVLSLHQVILYLVSVSFPPIRG